jgi:anti-sigma regulatory factor (Ser/Thr protein kinase)
MQAAREEIACSPVLAAEPASCRAVKQFLREVLGGDGDDLVEVAELVASELAANAVRHASSPFTTRVLIGDGALRLAVTDRAPTPPGWSGFPVDRRHGLGIVAALTRDWGVLPVPTGKTAWADIDREGRG